MYRPSTPTLPQRIRARVTKSRRQIFLPIDFADLSGRVQVYRALKQLVDDGELMRVGYGLYARAIINPINGRAMLASPGGFKAVSRAALTRLGVRWQLTPDEVAFNEGRSNQFPANAVVRLRSRFVRRVACNGMELRLER